MSLFEWNLKNEINLPNSSWKRALLLTGLCLDTLYFLPIFLFSHSEVHTVALLPKNLVFGTLALQMSPGAISICSWRFCVDYGTYKVVRKKAEEKGGPGFFFFFFFTKRVDQVSRSGHFLTAEGAWIKIAPFSK